MEFREIEKNKIVAIDYYSRRVWGRVIENKLSDEIVRFVKEIWGGDENKPEELITDNGREFINDKFKEMCRTQGIKHRKVSIEAHRSNGRVERVIGTLRETMAKVKVDVFENKVSESIRIYNTYYHSGIKFTPLEAIQGDSGKVMIENGPEGGYSKRFIARKREKFIKNQIIRVAKSENLGSQGKYMKGRFLAHGKILEVCQNDSYIVRLKEGRVVKKRHYDLKSIVRMK
ncbi:hypothetical protein NGRA_2185 [Nosema granulosis]|uniref:Integrase catalytic domain-containing protein n=1 Tax=Nosema granulosis TaxID=83296 RepID=A0A9P6KYG2_9MICR|nr:hypothetical protein NGRA_2185 [Nosema granulosis]